MNNSRIILKFKENCLKQDKAPSTPNNVVNLYIAYELNIWSQNLNDKFTLKYCLFGNVKITKDVDPDKYSDTRYGIGFDSHSLFFDSKF